MMKTRTLGLACFLLLTACADRDALPDPQLFDATVTFTIVSGREGADRSFLSKQTTTFLAVDKPGRPRMIDGWQEDESKDSRYGRHNFPMGTAAPALAGYYWGALSNAGWKQPTDFHPGEGTSSLHFFGIRSIEAGADSDEVKVTVSRSARDPG